MTAQTPCPGEIWRHYKGEKYCSVLGVSKPCHPVDIAGMGVLYYGHMPDDSRRSITVYGGSPAAADLWHLRDYTKAPIADSPLVVYACSGSLWVVSVSEFCENFARVDFDAHDVVKVPRDSPVVMFGSGVAGGSAQTPPQTHSRRVTGRIVNPDGSPLRGVAVSNIQIDLIGAGGGSIGMISPHAPKA